jgi:hypothetical protein
MMSHDVKSKSYRGVYPLASALAFEASRTWTESKQTGREISSSRRSQQRAFTIDVLYSFALLLMTHDLLSVILS